MCGLTLGMDDCHGPQSSSQLCPSPSHHLPKLLCLQQGVELHAHLPSVCWDSVRLELAQVLCLRSQLLRVHISNCSGVSRRRCFPAVIHELCLSLHCSPSPAMISDPWREVSLWVENPAVSQSLHVSALCQLLHIEASLMSSNGTAILVQGFVSSS